MKNTVKISFVYFLIFLFAGCNKDYITIDNPTKITASDSWKTEKDAWLAVVATYSALSLEGTYRQWYPFVWEARSDMSSNELNWQLFNVYPKFILQDRNMLHEVWAHHFQGISRANQVLAYVPAINMDAAKKERFLAEAKFLRSLFYYNLSILYGNPPLILEPIVDPQYRPANATNAEVLAQVVTDLKNCLPLLPATVPDNELGRVTKGGAQALLAKTYLLQKDFVNAEETLKEIINSGLFDLTSDFGDNFKHTTEFNKESVFEISMSDMFNTDFWAQYTQTPPLGDRSASYLTPKTVGSEESACHPNIWFLNQFTDTTVDGKTDPRKAMTILYDTAQIYFGKKGKEVGVSTDTAGNLQPYIYYKKYTNWYWKTVETTSSPINRRLIRYADILLLYAECLNENGKTSDAYQFIDKVRDRVNVVSLTLQKPGLSKEEMKKQIEHERIVELGGEGLRWVDLYRWGFLDSQTYLDTLKKHDYEFGYKPFRPGLDKWLPIPPLDLSLNSNLIQNKGW